jgi:hypothetical protein
MTNEQLQSKLIDHLIRYEFRKRDDEARIIANAHMSMAAAVYVMKLAVRLGHDDLKDDLNREVNEYLQSLDSQRQALSDEFSRTGLGPPVTWYDEAASITATDDPPSPTASM